MPQYFIKPDQSIEALNFEINPAPDLFNRSISAEGFYSFSPQAGVGLYRLALLDDPRATIFATKSASEVRVFMRYDGSHPQTPRVNVVEEVPRDKLTQKLEALVSQLASASK